MERTREEYGGFLPLELFEKLEYYEFEKDRMQRFNSAKSAISMLLNTLHLKKIYMPYYMCPNVCKMVEGNDLEVEYYSIDRQMTPPLFEDLEGVCVYVTDYFGIMDKKIDEYVKAYRNATVIIDNCHAFYHKPIFADNIYNVYSCKKFFGVPDGAYLIGNNLDKMEMECTYSSEYASYLLKCAEQGTNACYTEKKDVDSYLANHCGGMSILAKKILRTVDYEYVKQRRFRNFQLYQEAFGEVNIINMEKESIPYMYPLNVKKDIKAELVKEKIYVPTLWQSTLSDEYKGSFEYSLSKETIFLPLDQRYNDQDIMFIIQMVQNLI